MVPLLAILALLSPQGGTVPPSPFDEVFELELTAESPTATAEYFVDFEGTLHVWTRAGLDLSLVVEDVDEGELLASDDESGGGTTPYVRLEVELNDELAITVASANGSRLGSLELHVVAAPETDATREAVSAARERIAEVLRLREQGDLDPARAVVEEALARLLIARDARHSEAVAAVVWDLGAVAYQLGHKAATRSCLRAAREHRERTLPETHPYLLLARANLAGMFSMLGDLAAARALQEAVLEVHERTLPEDHPDLIADRYNLALTLFRLGDFTAARALFEAAVESYERIHHPDHPRLLSARSNLAVTVRELGDLSAARALHEAVLEARERTLPEDHPDLLDARNNLAVVLTELGDLSAAHALFEVVLRASERSLREDHPGLIRARHNMATVVSKLGDYPAARAFREAVLEAAERSLPEDHPDLLQARGNLAATLRRMGDLAGARALQEEVLEACERTLPEDHPDVLLVRNSLAFTLCKLGDLSAARALVRDHVAGVRARVLASLPFAPREASEVVRSELHRLDGLLFLSQSGDSALKALVFELQETMRVVALEGARALRGATDPEIEALMDEARSVRAALNDLVSGRSEEGGLSAELTQLVRERDRLERQASRRLAENGVVTRPVEVGPLSAALGPDGAAVAYRRVSRWYADEEAGEVGGDYFLAQVLLPSGALTRIDLGPAPELEELVATRRVVTGVPLLRGVRAGSDNRHSEQALGAKLRERLLDPVLAELGPDTRRLHVCADDIVFLVPLDALPYEDGRVGDRWTIVNEVSFARLMVPGEPLETPPGFFALGGVDYDAGSDTTETIDAAAGSSRAAMTDRFAHLLQTRIEAQTAGLLFEELCETAPVIVTEEGATKAALFQHAPGKRYMHLATHGWFASEAVRSTADAVRGGDDGWKRMSAQERVTGLAPMLLCGLALAGANNGRDSLGRMSGIVTAEELCALDLSACELAVLSACETNVGIRRAGQGIQSLQAALYAAGARSSITSLWKVDDAATRRLMERFYKNLWEAKMPKHRALWEAKRALRDDGAPVRDWAGWVLTGDPD